MCYVYNGRKVPSAVQHISLQADTPVSHFLGQSVTLFYSMVLVGREDYGLRIITHIQVASHVTLEIIYGQKVKK